MLETKYIPASAPGTSRELESHETVCILNANDREANVTITVFFHDRDPVGPYRVIVPARRTRHIRYNDLTDPERIPHGTDYSSIIEADVPVVAQHTRLDSRRPALALLSTMAFPVREN